MKKLSTFIIIIFVFVVLAYIALEVLPINTISIIPSRTNTLHREYTKTTHITLSDPMEFDFLSKAEVLSLRTERVNLHSVLVSGEYIPADIPFGQIIDGKPWWGLYGQYCYGTGDKSIEGLSEESRYVLNPFMLIGINQLDAYIVSDRLCYPVYLRPVSLIWSGTRAKLTYDYARFIQEKNQLKMSTDVDFITEDYNARDFGFTYFHADVNETKGIAGYDQSKLLTNAVAMKNFIHVGGSCRYPGGCNNTSPYDPEVIFYVDSYPAVLHIKLWYQKPPSPSSPTDFDFIIRFE